MSAPISPPEYFLFPLLRNTNHPDPPWLLVVTPTLGKRSSLKKTILSVASIGGDNIRHVLSGPRANLDQYSLQFPWIEIFDDNGASGVYESINALLSSDHYNSYKYFAYINDDDQWLPGFSSLINAVKEDSTIDIAYGRTIFILSDRRCSIRPGAFTSRPADAILLFQTGIPAFTQQSMIVRKKLLHDQGLFNLSLPITADSAMWTSILKEKPSVVAFNIFASAYELRGQRLSTNTSLIRTEDDAIHSNSKKSSIAINKKHVMAVILYRITNIPVYLSRLISSILGTAIFINTKGLVNSD